MPYNHASTTAPCRTALRHLAHATGKLASVFDPNSTRSAIDTDLIEIENMLRRALHELNEARAAVRGGFEPWR